MRPRIERIDKLSAPSPWFVIAYLAWAALIVGVHLVNTLTERELIICTLRRITSIPCPTCGSTRAVESALQGDLLTAFSYNPLVMVLLLLGGAALALRYLGKRRIVLGLSGRERFVAWLVMLVAVSLNWWHVIVYHGGA